ncbi:sodium:proton antiporter [Salinicoccus sp. ID82-1]|uniref:Na+/H+ antiporter family protein n=1 Tax=Salinicoccus sp. ID82-1 TaxID=2820269 RepID=UPI001F383B77|nr:Na+/H+ antiporter NhaC family protein [Salinicoccus sp. ID82-1]MCG1010462.1 sodium:proton antiporter [Salinicoccus sp. ID82-1]
MNAVVIAVLIMIVLSLLRLNVVLALFIGALAGGLVAGMGYGEVIGVFTEGITGGAEIALSYALLGGFAALIAYSGITEVLVTFIIRTLKKEQSKKARIIAKVSIIAALLAISIMSQNLIPIHIAFIPILIPPLLSLMNELGFDRRLIAVVLTFGLTFPYVLFPIGFGQIFQNTIVSGFESAGTDIAFGQVAPALVLPASGFVVGLILALVYYRKQRIYETKTFGSANETEASMKTIAIALVAIAATFGVQILTDSMIFGALAGIMVFFLSFQFKWSRLDNELVDGIRVMAYIGIVMLAANGFAAVISETGHVGPLVDGIAETLSGQKVLIVGSMLLVGLIVTMGIGSSFATIPIIASIFIPMGMELELSIPAIIAIIGTAGALGDAGSPASDSTLGPTAGLSADGQHDHIWDTCVPTFIFLNIPVLIAGFFAGLIL